MFGPGNFFGPTALDQPVKGCTYIPLARGFVYLVAIMDGRP
ncbi:MAG: hypothetical protein ACR2RF_03530 [Geminicoccaceae bacterium]